MMKLSAIIRNRVTFTSLLLALFTLPAAANAPSGYYEKAKGLNKGELLEALETIVGEHEDVGYSSLWNVFKESDVREDGTIWDMYSTSQYIPGSDENHGDNSSSIGVNYNREHSMPKSWFNDAYPMYSDAFHIYPTDTRVNNQRDNYPYGECANGTTLPSANGVEALGRLGTSTYEGYTGIVFEPDDEYKGDFARTYFYMAAAYNSLIGDWSSDQLAGNSYPCFSSWAVNMLMDWHRQDPVSQKETDRNEVIYSCQHNRNPFIDHPEMAEYIWGDKQNEGWIYDDSTGDDNDDDDTSTSTTFFEDFEWIGYPVSYYTGTFQGNACLWQLTGMYLADSSDEPHGKYCARLRFSDGGCIEMAEDKLNGAGVLSFYGATFNNDSDSDLAISYSTDSGSTWTLAQTVTLTNGSLQEFSITLNLTDNVRFRLEQQNGYRVRIDDIIISDYPQSSSLTSKTIESHSDWNAFSSNKGQLTLMADNATNFKVFSIDAKQKFNGTVNGIMTLSLEHGIYIIIANNQSKKVIVK